MSLKIKYWYLPSAEDGWERWQLKDGEPQLTKGYARHLPKLDDASLVMLPVESTQCHLEQVFTGDKDTEILAVETALESKSLDALHANQVGVYPIQQEIDRSLYMGISLDKQIKASVKWIDANFDYSPRSRSIQRGVLFWRERSRWVYGFYVNGKCVFANVLAGERLESQLKGLLPKTQMSLAMMGLDVPVGQVFVEGNYDQFNQEECNKLLGCDVIKVERSEVVSLDSLSLNYTPLQVENLRDKRKKRARNTVFLAICLLLLAMLGWNIYQKRQRLVEGIEANNNRVEQYAPTVKANEEAMLKIDELSSVMTKLWPLNKYSEVIKSMPKGPRLIRIEQLEFRPNFIQVRGRAASFAVANQFGTNLRKNDFFEEYEWSKNPPRGSLDKSHYKFDYRAEIKNEGYE